MSESKLRRTVRRVVAGTLTTGVILTAGVAFAAWTAGGSGNGYAKAGTVGALTTVDASASTTAQLYPGGTGDVKITISNPNSFPVTVTGVSGNGTITSDAGAGCNSSTGVTFTNTTGLTEVAAASTTTTITLANKASMSSSSANACQGAVFTIPVTLTGTVG
jgi:hypothetical protein